MNIFSPIHWFADWSTYNVLTFSHNALGEAVSYFIYDVTKILLLLSLIIFLVSIIRTFLPPEKVRNILSGKKTYTGNVIASLFGIITPFCTCSAIPLFLGFVQAGVPLGTTFSFLVASPMINEVALVLLLGLFGWKIALIYVTCGLIIAILSGIVIGRIKPENLIESFVFQGVRSSTANLSTMSRGERIKYARTYTLDVLKKVWPYILIGIAIGAWIHGYVPTDFLVKYASSDKWYTVPFAVLIGIPLYSNAAGIIPLVSALTEKGVSMGTTLAFMMSVTALSLPEFMILKKIMRIKLIIIFASIVGLGIMLIGLLFNLTLR